jgi:hypothetical protein
MARSLFNVSSGASQAAPAATAADTAGVDPLLQFRPERPRAGQIPAPDIEEAERKPSTPPSAARRAAPMGLVTGGIVALSIAFGGWADGAIRRSETDLGAIVRSIAVPRFFDRSERSATAVVPRPESAPAAPVASSARPTDPAGPAVLDSNPLTPPVGRLVDRGETRVASSTSSRPSLAPVSQARTVARSQPRPAPAAAEGPAESGATPTSAAGLSAASAAGITAGAPSSAAETAAPAGAATIGYLSINATPWADVWVDGKSVGTTPLANLEVTAGNHEILWRHPHLGERRETITVTASTPARAATDFSR